MNTGQTAGGLTLRWTSGKTVQMKDEEMETVVRDKEPCGEKTGEGSLGGYCCKLVLSQQSTKQTVSHSRKKPTPLVIFLFKKN